MGHPGWHLRFPRTHPIKTMFNHERRLVRQAKKQLGPITSLDCRDVDTVRAHQQLGQAARAQIHKILARRFDTLGDQSQGIAQIRRARKYQAALQGKLQIGGLAISIQQAIRQYQASLAAWSQGAGLVDFCHPTLPKTVDGLPVSAGELATLLQEDEVGCQTGVIREHSGAVILWHSEEDYEETPGQRFDKLRLFFFKAADDRIAGGFVYPDLLPGPTFGWQAGGFAQAIDTLHVRPAEFEDAILPNCLAWLSLYLGPQVSRRELAAQLGPFQGGYSLTCIYQQAGLVHVEKVEFANQQVASCSLGSKAGDYLFQTNVIRDLSQPIAAEEQTSPQGRSWNEQRLVRTDRLIRPVQQASQPLEAVLKMLRSSRGGEAAYSNRDVKAYFIGRMTAENTSIRVGSGAALIGDKLFSMEL